MKTATLDAVEEGLELLVAKARDDIKAFDKWNRKRAKPNYLIAQYLQMRVERAEDALADFKAADFGA